MISFKAILGLLFVLLIAAIAVLAVVTYRINEDVVQAASKVKHSHQVIEKADQISFLFRDVRFAVNNIIIRREHSRDDVYNSTVRELEMQVGELRQLTSDDKDQQANIDSLDVRLARFYVVSDSLIRMVIAKQAADKILVVFSDNEAVRNDVGSTINTIKAAEKELLAQREHASQEKIDAFKLTFILLLAGIGILLGSTFLVIRYNFNKSVRLQREMSRANLLFEKIFYESPIAIVISDLKTGEILNCNQVFADTVNFSTNELIGRTAAELGIFENQEKRDQMIAGARKDGMARRTEVYIQPRAREPMYVSIQGHIISLYERECSLTAILDLTTHKRAEDKIRKALATERELNRLKSNFVTLASHEFKTPLTAILSSAFLLEKYSFGENQAKAAKQVSRIKSSVNNLVSILDEFLSVTKIEEGQVQPNIEKIDLPRYLKGICDNLQTVAKPGQTIYYSHSGENEINADPVLLANILNNLVSNSIKYSEENCPIHVTSTVNSKVHVTVKDNGIGIPKEDQKHLFERFYRASNAGTVQGTGLGLHIMKHYVEMMNGSVNFQSEVGKGTEVNVTFDHI